MHLISNFGKPSSGKLFRYSPVAGFLLVCINPAWAGDYFDPGFLGNSGDNTAVDLSAFSEAGGVQPGKYTVWVFVNQRNAGQYTLDFQKNTQGKIAPVLTPSELETFGVNVRQLPDLKDLPATAEIDNIGALIPQATTMLDLARLRLDISVPQAAMQPEVRGAVDPSQWEEGISALMANYSLSAGRTTNSGQNQTSHNNNLFATVRAGANTGPWRLRSTMTHTRVENNGGNNALTTTQTRFSNTYLARDIRGWRSNLLMGESSTGSDVFDGIPFRGVKLSSNEQMLPSQLRGYAPAISGVANSNARVTVRQNGNVVYETYVAPGPFYINDIQQAGLSGDYDVKVTEADGTERQFIVPYSSLPVMLRPGGWKYELTAGQYDGNLTDGSRRADFMLGSVVYGLPGDVTLFGGILAAKDYQAFNIGTGVSLGYVGALSADITNSSAKFDNESTLIGQSYRVRYSKSLLSTGTSAQLVAMLGQFEQHIEADTPLADVLPTIYNKYPVRYRDYTLRELCQEMHDLYVSFDVKSLQKEMFRKRSFPRVVMNPQDANREFIRGDVELVRLSEAEGRVAAEGALPYPPGVLCVVPGEVWGGAVLRYFLALEEGVNMLPGFSPELQGVYSETDPDGIKRLYGYVLKG